MLNHLGIIVDGNRRWAKKNKKPSIFGHKKGLDNVRELTKYIFSKGVKFITLYLFSTENWNRSKTEVSYLMKLFENSLSKKNIQELNDKNIRVKIIGQKEKLSKKLQKKIEWVEKETKNNKKGQLNLCISYGGRPEIIQAIKKIIKEGASEITEKLVSDNLWTAGTPDPDLIIRTSGEQRLSNFLTWQSAYSELYFPNKYWPEFTKKDIDKALEEYDKRQRRFGK